MLVTILSLIDVFSRLFFDENENFFKWILHLLVTGKNPLFEVTGQTDKQPF